MMGDILLVQNSRIESSGYLGNLLNQDGFKIHSVYAKHDKIPDKKFSLVIILGAPESANDDLAYLREEEKLIKKSVEKDVPVLGICLGSQLIAKTFGANVYTGHKKEIGFYDDLRYENGSNLFSGFEQPFTVFHWHGDTFDLPKNASRLAYSKEYQNQSFQIGSAVGVQFHLEVDEYLINLWLDKTSERLKEIPYIDPEKIRSDIDTKVTIIKNNMEIFYNNLKKMFDL